MVRLAREMNLRREIEGTIHNEHHENSSGRLGILQNKMTDQWLDMISALYLQHKERVQTKISYFHC
jgi:hypothetical protein